VIRLALLAALAVTGSSFTLSSSAFAPGGPIPKKYTCDRGLGAQPVSPPLHWTAGPRGTRAFAIRVDDTDAHFLHWLGWGISANARGLKAGQHPPHEEPNSLGNPRYDGPCPQDHRVHHYLFRVYALDKNIAPSVPAGTFPKAHVLAIARLVGTYKH
jgi:Raf kinase inhibitor-like YbhB/YbcL family protein